jgi:hypothetical protein
LPATHTADVPLAFGIGGGGGQRVNADSGARYGLRATRVGEAFHSGPIALEWLRSAREVACYGLRACRIGEASHPGPPHAAASSPSSSSRAGSHCACASGGSASAREFAGYGLRATKIGEASHPGPVTAPPVRSSPYHRNQLLDDVPGQLRLKNTFLEVASDGGSSGGRALRRVHTEGDEPDQAAASSTGVIPNTSQDVSMSPQDAPPGGTVFFNISDGVSDGNMASHGAASSSNGGRFYCPVPGCPASDPVRSPGWQTFQNMRLHLEEHSGGRLTGGIPQGWLEQHAHGQCSVCSRILHRKFLPACPKCRPSLHHAPANTQGPGRTLPEGCPELASIF